MEDKMSSTPEQQRRDLKQQIEDSLKKARAYRDKLKRAAFVSTVLNIILSALATFVAGLAGIKGIKVTGDWPNTCRLAAGFALGATVVAGLQRQLADPGLLARAGECVGKLKSLRAQTLLSNYDPEKLTIEYQEIFEAYPDVDC
jgi:hypothetical protein